MKCASCGWEAHKRELGQELLARELHQYWQRLSLGIIMGPLYKCGATEPLNVNASHTLHAHIRSH